MPTRVAALRARDRQPGPMARDEQQGTTRTSSCAKTPPRPDHSTIGVFDAIAGGVRHRNSAQPAEGARSQIAPCTGRSKPLTWTRRTSKRAAVARRHSAWTPVRVRDGRQRRQGHSRRKFQRDLPRTNPDLRSSSRAGAGARCFIAALSRSWTLTKSPRSRDDLPVIHANNLRTIRPRIPRNTRHQEVAKPMTNQQDAMPALTC